MPDSDDIEPIAQARYNDMTAVGLATAAEGALDGVIALTETRHPSLPVDQVYRVLSALTRLVEKLPQAITQTAEVLSRTPTDQLTVTSGKFRDDPEAAVRTAQTAVTQEAIPAIASLRTALDHAQAAIAHLELRSPQP